MSARKTPWIVAGGRPNEFGHCQRCGEGLVLGRQHIEVVLAATKAFTKVHSHCKERGYSEREMTLQSWQMSRDTGVSSATIYYVFTGQSPYDDFGIPHDPDDFGRCYRLLKLAPEWGSRLSAVAEKFPQWGPFVREWPTLTAMYERALQTKDGGEMYDFMQKLEGEAVQKAEATR